RLRDVLEIEFVAEVRRVLRQDAEAKKCVDSAVLLLEPQLELCFEVVELVEMAHDGDCSSAIKLASAPRPGTESPGSSSNSGSRANSRSWSRGCGTVSPGSSRISSPKRRRSRSIVRGPY